MAALGQRGALVAARVAQGAGASAIVRGSLALLAVIYTEPDARSRAIGLWGGAGGIAAAVSPVLGGVVASTALSLIQRSRTVSNLAMRISEASGTPG